MIGRRGSAAATRAVDLIGAAGLLVVLSPVVALVAGLIRLRLGRPVLFRQRRPGLGGATFELIKFRTMRDRTDASGRPLPDGERLTGLGRTLRASSLDELPTLWNVLRGEMALVGPRPLLPEYLPHYSATESRRHEVRPGITGWAQLNGRNDLSWDEKLALDVWYVDHRTLALDLRILLRTLAVPFSRRGISRAGHATAPRFDDERRARGRAPTPPHRVGPAGDADPSDPT